MRRPYPHLSHLPFHVLLSIGDGEKHGYRIIKEIESRTDGRLRPRSGTLYAAIQGLLDDGYVVETGARPGPKDDQRRKYYRITDRGRRQAALEVDRMANLVEIARAMGFK